MGTLHLNGTLDLSGRLTLGGKVLVDGKEVLVVVTPIEAPHSMSALPPVPPPKPDDPFIQYIWVTKSPNTGITIKERAVVVDGATYVQGTAKTSRFLKAGNCKVTINDVAVMVEVTIDDKTVELIYSGQT